MTKLILTTMELCGNKCHACAIEEEGQIMELRLEAAARQSILGNIYVGQVENIASNIQAAFVLIAPGVRGYFPLQEAEQVIYASGKAPGSPLRPGDQILVQVSRDAMKGKLPALTANLNFTGKYLVLTTGEKKFGLSGKLSGSERHTLSGWLEAEAARPDKEVYALVGDGSFMMLNSEIPTAMQENAKITVVVFDNCAFGCINNLQMGNGVGSLATEMRHRNETTGKLDGDYCYTDFGKIGEGFGMKAFYAKTPDEFRKAVQDAKKESVSCIIDAKVLPKTMAEGYESWWHIGVASTSKSDEVKAARKRIDDHLAEARMY